MSDEAATFKSPRTDAVHVAAFVLTVVEGPDAGKTFTIDGSDASRTLLGQSPACAIRLADRHVSRRHAALSASGERLRVVDLDSTNGTRIGDVDVTDAHLRPGAILRVGESALRVERAGAPREVPLSKETRFGRVVGASVAMRRLYPLCARLARSTVPVLIEGETGTGKEALAESLHEASDRAQGPFVVFDCTTVPASLLESELFGHERGAFTGAVAPRAGVLEQAHGGTLLVDEIGELDLALQPKLLRALERREIQRLGSNARTKVDVRVLVATRRDLDREVQEGRFRDDLFFRIAVARIELPPLRERFGDVSLLARHFWTELGGEGELDTNVVERLERYAFPGNVRELANAVARHAALGELADASGTEADAEPLLDLPYPRARDRALAEFERRYIEHVLAKNGGQVARAARASGIARRYFNQILARTR